MSDLQVLVSTMNQSDNSLCAKMNLSSDAVIINQSDTVGYRKFKHKEYNVDFYTFHERGLARSRNEALMRASADIVCLADDDLLYTDTYREDILNEYRRHPEADAIIFNVEAINGNNRHSAKIITEFARVGKIEYREYGSVRITFRRKKLLYKNVSFNMMFGAGTEFSCGEDTIFLKELIDKGFRVYKSPVKIAQVDMSESTWFTGYNEKLFHDKGALIGATYPKISYLLVMLQAIRNSKKRLGSYKHFCKIYRWYADGLKDYQNKSQ